MAKKTKTTKAKTATKARSAAKPTAGTKATSAKTTATKPATKPAAKLAPEVGDAKPARTTLSIDQAARTVAASPATTDADASKSATPTENDAAVNEVVNKKLLLSRVAARTGLRPNKTREIVEAVLEELGAALSDGEKLKLPPLGTLMVNRQKDVANGEVIICKLRRKKKAEDDQDPLAPAAE
ncbi:HU family DNA-binding protein [Aliiroseovarius marinus]|uniref:HU family DNA-binding protein n=1 Tax=Aliiroseovarius marinus TaxID=2500159 RepID=UPI003D7E1AAA